MTFFKKKNLDPQSYGRKILNYFCHQNNLIWLALPESKIKCENVTFPLTVFFIWTLWRNIYMYKNSVNQLIKYDMLNT